MVHQIQEEHRDRDERHPDYCIKYRQNQHQWVGYVYREAAPSCGEKTSKNGHVDANLMTMAVVLMNVGFEKAPSGDLGSALLWCDQMTDGKGYRPAGSRRQQGPEDSISRGCGAPPLLPGGIDFGWHKVVPCKRSNMSAKEGSRKGKPTSQSHARWDHIGEAQWII